MEGEVGEKKIAELGFLFDMALNDPWLFNELYDNYPFPGTALKTACTLYNSHNEKLLNTIISATWFSTLHFKNSPKI